MKNGREEDEVINPNIGSETSTAWSSMIISSNILSELRSASVSFRSSIEVQIACPVMHTCVIRRGMDRMRGRGVPLMLLIYSDHRSRVGHRRSRGGGEVELFEFVDVDVDDMIKVVVHTIFEGVWNGIHTRSEYWRVTSTMRCPVTWRRGTRRRICRPPVGPSTVSGTCSNRCWCRSAMRWRQRW